MAREVTLARPPACSVSSSLVPNRWDHGVHREPGIFDITASTHSGVILIIVTEPYVRLIVGANLA